MDGSGMYVEKCTGIMGKLEEIITDVQDTQLVAYLLRSSAEATRFLRSLDKDVTLLKVMNCAYRNAQFQFEFADSVLSLVS